MTVLTILGILIGVVATGWSCMAVHEYAKQKYAYNVFTVGNLLFMFLPIGLFLLSISFVPESQTYVSALVAGNLDMILLIALSAISLAGFIIYLARQTNIWVAVFVGGILFLVAVAILVVLFLIAAASDKKGKKQK